jgi:hypothetical protein
MQVIDPTQADPVQNAPQPAQGLPDVGALLLKALQDFWQWLSEQLDSGAEELFRNLIAFVQTAPFITRTDLGLINTLSSLVGQQDIGRLVDAVLKLGLLLAAIAYAGHTYFGWPGLGDSLQRWGVTLLLTRLTWQLQDWSLAMMDTLTRAITVSVPDAPAFTGLNPLILLVLLAFYAWQIFQLAIVTAERVAWLIILKPIGPLASLTWVHHKSAWIASMYWRIWIGWLIGQFLVLLAISAMVLLARRGGIEGYFLSAACLIVARKAITMLVPSAGGMSIKVGPVRLG